MRLWFVSFIKLLYRPFQCLFLTCIIITILCLIDWSETVIWVENGVEIKSNCPDLWKVVKGFGLTYKIPLSVIIVLMIVLLYFFGGSVLYLIPLMVLLSIFYIVGLLWLKTDLLLDLGNLKLYRFISSEEVKTLIAASVETLAAHHQWGVFKHLWDSIDFESIVLSNLHIHHNVGHNGAGSLLCEIERSVHLAAARHRITLIHAEEEKAFWQQVYVLTFGAVALVGHCISQYITWMAPLVPQVPIAGAGAIQDLAMAIAPTQPAPIPFWLPVLNFYERHPYVFFIGLDISVVLLDWSVHFITSCEFFSFHASPLLPCPRFTSCSHELFLLYAEQPWYCRWLHFFKLF